MTTPSIFLTKIPPYATSSKNIPRLEVESQTFLCGPKTYLIFGTLLAYPEDSILCCLGTDQQLS